MDDLYAYNEATKMFVILELYLLCYEERVRCDSGGVAELCR